MKKVLCSISILFCLYILVQEIIGGLLIFAYSMPLLTIIMLVILLKVKNKKSFIIGFSLSIISIVFIVLSLYHIPNHAKDLFVPDYLGATWTRSFYIFSKIKYRVMEVNFPFCRENQLYVDVIYLVVQIIISLSILTFIIFKNNFERKYFTDKSILNNQLTLE